MVLMCLRSVFLAAACVPLITALPILHSPSTLLHPGPDDIHNRDDVTTTNMTISLIKRSKADGVAAAVAGTTVAVGVFILVLMFVALHLYKRKLVQLARLSRPKTAPKETRKLHREPKEDASSLQVNYQIDEAGQQQSRSMEGYLGRIKEKGSSLVRTFKMRGRSKNVTSKPILETAERSSESPWRPEHQVTTPLMHIGVPMAVEVQHGRHDRPDSQGRAPMVLPRLKTHPTELCGSDEGMKNTVIPIQRRAKDTSRWSMRTLGRELLRDAMHEPDPSQYDPSPETPMVQSGWRVISPLQTNQALMTPVMPCHYHRGTASTEAQTLSPLSPTLRGNEWTIQESHIWLGSRVEDRRLQ